MAMGVFLGIFVPYIPTVPYDLWATSDKEMCGGNNLLHGQAPRFGRASTLRGSQIHRPYL